MKSVLRNLLISISIFYNVLFLLHSKRDDSKYALVILPLKSIYFPGEIIVCVDITKQEDAEILITGYYSTELDGTKMWNSLVNPKQVFMIPRDVLNLIYIQCVISVPNVTETNRTLIQGLEIYKELKYNKEIEIITTTTGKAKFGTVYHCKNGRFRIDKFTAFPKINKFIELSGYSSVLKLKRNLRRTVKLYCGNNEMTIGSLTNRKDYKIEIYGESKAFMNVGEELKCYTNLTLLKDGLFYWKKLSGPEPGFIQYDNGILKYSEHTTAGFYRYRCQVYFPGKVPVYSQVVDIKAENSEINFTILNPKYTYTFDEKILCIANGYPEIKVKWESSAQFSFTQLPNAAIIHLTKKIKGKHNLTCTAFESHDSENINPFSMEILLLDNTDLKVNCYEDRHIVQVLKLGRVLTFVLFLISLIRYLIPMIWLQARKTEELENGYVRMNRDYFFHDVNYCLSKFKTAEHVDTSLSDIDSIGSELYRTVTAKESMAAGSSRSPSLRSKQVCKKTAVKENFQVALGLIVRKAPGIFTDSKEKITFHKSSFPKPITQ